MPTFLSLCETCMNSINELRIGAWQPRSLANGPGERFVLWVQGCALRCRGCVNSQFWPEAGGQLVSVDALAATITATTGIEGVTYSGGEPFLQAGALAALSERVRVDGLSVFCYSGYSLEELRALCDPNVDRLLASTDVLVDGPFIQDRADNLPWRGSANQRVHFLTSRYAAGAGDIARCEPRVEVTVKGAAWSMTGNWPQGFAERLENALRR